ncbi:MAG TPA: polyprenyl diphosphate synthase [Candidatus Polarisedimenticolaceae bacterium]|nr:polyprenyl diphosphate synthase [Candidatus Polarisedimenticolaceae bacterium]
MANLPRHTAIIPDGNGRWAEARGLPRPSGHKAGADAVRRSVEAAREIGLPLVTLYAFSSDNWQRPRREVETLFSLLRRYLDEETARLREQEIRIEAIGRRDRLPSGILTALERTESQTASGRAMHLRIAIDYSSRDAIARAADRVPSRSPARREDLARALGTPDVDLMIRTGGEQRLSDFLLWEAAYAELVFLPVPWPDFERSDLEGALEEFTRRRRRFGAVPARRAV